MAAKKGESVNFSFHPFENLKQAIESKGIKVSYRQNITQRNESINDKELFIKAMREVRERKEFREIPVCQKRITPLVKVQPSEKDTLRILDEIVHGNRPIRLKDTQEYVEWINPNYKRNDIVRMLHEGRFSVQDSIDLHGLVVEEAEAELRRFLKDSLQRGLRCIKIIHGRGLRSPKGPVLKGAIIRLLSQFYRKNIIAFVTARQCDSGLGGLYVLLKST